MFVDAAFAELQEMEASVKAEYRLRTAGRTSAAGLGDYASPRTGSVAKSVKPALSINEQLRRLGLSTHGSRAMHAGPGPQSSATLVHVGDFAGEQLACWVGPRQRKSFLSAKEVLGESYSRQPPPAPAST